MFIGVTPTVLRPSLLSAILKPQDVFATSLINGNSSGQKVLLPFAPDFSWLKTRNTAQLHQMYDKLRGPGKYLSSNATAAEENVLNGYGLVSFDSDGFTLGQNYNGENGGGTTVAAWSWKRAAKFFDAKQYTATGTGGQQILHDLAGPVGMVAIKCTSVSGTNWNVWHRSLVAGQVVFLNTTDAAASVANRFLSVSDTAVTIGANNEVNNPGQQFLMRVWAHDPSADGIVQCGSTSVSNGVLTVPHGWAGGAQWLLYKVSTDANSPWFIYDTARSGANFGGTDPFLLANSPNAENPSGNFVSQSNGVLSANDGTNGTYIWAAIRAPY